MTLSDPDQVWFGDDRTEPSEGAVLVLNYHHDGESHWCTPKQARARIEEILNGAKPEEEWGSRMEAMKVVPFGSWYGLSLEARSVYAKACSEARSVFDKARSEAWSVFDKACSEARSVYDKARSEAWSVFDKARSEAWSVYDKACSEAWSVYDKARSEAWSVYDKAYSEAGTVFDKARSEARSVYAKAYSEAGTVLLQAFIKNGADPLPAEAWAAEESRA